MTRKACIQVQDVSPRVSVVGNATQPKHIRTCCHFLHGFEAGPKQIPHDSGKFRANFKCTKARSTLVRYPKDSTIRPQISDPSGLVWGEFVARCWGGAVTPYCEPALTWLQTVICSFPARTSINVIINLRAERTEAQC